MVQNQSAEVAPLILVQISPLRSPLASEHEEGESREEVGGEIDPAIDASGQRYRPKFRADLRVTSRFVTVDEHMDGVGICQANLDHSFSRSGAITTIGVGTFAC